jgi:uncharacterized damage-inducible protein DinB
MDVAALLQDLYGRTPPIATSAAEGLNADQLAWAPEPGANSIGWLLWHLTRVQDHHVSELLGEDQIWTRDERWAKRCGLEPDAHNTGYGHSADDVASVRPDGPDAVLGYLSAVDERTQRMLAALSDADLERIVDGRWDPPVTLGVRLISIADDCLQHVGQASYLRGLLGV